MTLARGRAAHRATASPHRLLAQAHAPSTTASAGEVE